MTPPDRVVCVLGVIGSALLVLCEVCPADEAPAAAAAAGPAGLAVADWQQIQGQLPVPAQTAYVKGSNTRAHNQFGCAVAVAGDTVVVGARLEDGSATMVNGNPFACCTYDSGAVYVLVRSGETWQQQAYLKAFNRSQNDNFGQAVAIAENILVVGAPSEDSAARGVDGQPQGEALAADSGAAYIFVREGTNWIQQAYLKASNTGPGDAFGSSVAVSGSTVVVGAPGEDSRATGVNPSLDNDDAINSGAAFVFVRNGTTWVQQASLKASNTDADDRFGASVCISSDRVVIGAYGEDGSDQNNNHLKESGAAYVFVRQQGTWAQTAYLKAAEPMASDQFGVSVAIAGDTVVVGADFAFASGAAYVFDWDGTQWMQQAQLRASNADALDRFGCAVALAQDTVIVGALGEDSPRATCMANNGSPRAGAAYVFVRDGTRWIEHAYLKAGNAGAGDEFGTVVAASGRTVMVGAPYEASSATGVNGDGKDNGAPVSGAAYLFLLDSTAVEIRPDIVVEQPADHELISGAATVDFGLVLTGNRSQRTFIIGNVGALDLTGLSVTVTGADASLFSISNAPASTVLAPCARASFTVTFGPDADGTKTATLRIASDDPDESPFDVVIMGSGVPPLHLGQEAYLKASNTGQGDYFGNSVALAGDTLVVGAPSEDSNADRVNGDQQDNSANSSGAAYVFLRTGHTWTQQAYLKAPNSEQGDLFGFSVAVSGDWIVVGAFLEDSSASGVNGNPADNSAENSGAAYVFVREGTNWLPQAYLKRGGNPNVTSGDRFATSVSISGDTIVIGAPNEASAARGINGNQNDQSAFGSGAAYIFVREGTNWLQQAYLKASNSEAMDAFGRSVSISGETVVVVAPEEDSNTDGVNGDQNDNSAPGSGAAYVFVRSGTNWIQQAYLKASNSDRGDQFGSSVAVFGDTIAVGGQDSAYIFARDNTRWSQQVYLKGAWTFGKSVALSADGVLIGADRQSSSGFNSGAAHAFARRGSNWIQSAYLKVSSSGDQQYFGSSVAWSDGTVVIGAPGEQSRATGVNGHQCNISGWSDSGAVYVFDPNATGLVLAPIISIEDAEGTELTNGVSRSDFGSVQVGGAVEQTFYVRNAGFSALTNVNVTISGRHARDFMIRRAPDATVPPRCQRTSFNLAFEPTATGPRTAMMQIASNDTNESPFSVLLTGFAPIPLEFAASSYNVNEADGVALVTLRRNDNDASLPFTAFYWTVGSSAGPGEDYLEQSRTLSFSPGEMTKVIAIPILNDQRYEETESFSIVLGTQSDDGQVVLGSTNDCRIDILDNDRVGFASPFYSVNEASAMALVTVERAGDALNEPLFIDFQTSSLGADPLCDYSEQTGTLAFAPGETKKVIAIPLFNDTRCPSDGNCEGTEQFLISLTSTSAIPALALCTVTIEDDSLGFAADSFFVSEAAGSALISLSRSSDPAGPATVRYSATNDTAVAGRDFVAQGGILSFGAGESNKTFSIPILDNPRIDGDRLVQLTLSDATGGICFSRSVAWLIIQDNELSENFSFRLGDAPEIRVGEEQGSIVLPVYRGGDSSQTASVDYGTWDGTALGERDYSPRNGTLTFAPLEVRKLITVPVLGNGRVEADRAFQVTLGNPSTPAPLDLAEVTARILDDERPGSLDLSFAPNTPGSDMRTLALQPDGRILVGGQAILRFQPDGRLDESFGPVDLAAGYSWQLSLLRDESILALGSSLNWKVGRAILVRLNPNGSTDTNFVPVLLAQRDGRFAVQQTGKILIHVLGTGLLQRLNPDGSPDPTFAAPPDVVGLAALQPDDKILVHTAGGTLDRLNADGTHDEPFRAPDGATFLALFADGKLLVLANSLLRLHPNGTVDTAFNPSPELPIGTGGPIVTQPDGKVLAPGFVQDINGSVGYRIIRMNVDGSWDRSFDVGDPFGPWWQSYISDLLLQPDGQLLVVGQFESVNGVSRGGLARLQGDAKYLKLEVSAPAGVGGDVRLKLSSQPGQSYVLEGSSDLQSWSSIRTNTALGFVLEFADLPASTQGAHFYRAAAKR